MRAEHPRPWLIVGGGLAAAEAAKTLRADGYEGRLVVVGDERHAPYERPPLSKDYLRGEKAVEELYAGDTALWKTPGIDLLLGRRAVRLDPRERVIVLDDGSRVRFDRLLIATGARARADLPGADAPFVHSIRTIDDADRLRTSASAASSAVVVGGGWIGAEVAASLRQLGLDVSLVIPGGEVLERRLGASVGRRYTAVHEEHGVRVIARSRAVAITGAREGPGVRLWDGRVISGDLVVLGLGAHPRVELAEAAGVAVDGGIVADEYLETRVAGIFVAGDVAAPWHPRYSRHLRLEHWDTARRQGRVAAANLLGRRQTYDQLPYFYSDQFDLGMESWGMTSGQDVVVRDLPDTGGFVALWLEGSLAIGGLQANGWELSKDVRGIVDAGDPIDRVRFADRMVPLAEVTLRSAA